MKRIATLLATTVACIGVSAPLASADISKQPTTPVPNRVTKPKVVTLGTAGKYRITSTVLNGKTVVKADRVTKTAHAAGSYLHVYNADQFCYYWNNQSAVDNIRYVEATLSSPAYYIGDVGFQYVRLSNIYVHDWHEWHEGFITPPMLAIQYECYVYGSDESLSMIAVGGSSVYWRYS